MPVDSLIFANVTLFAKCWFLRHCSVMSRLTATRRARLKARLAEKEEQLELANALYSKLLKNPTANYRFDSGEGSQQAFSRKLSEVRDSISVLESEIDRIEQQLLGGGVIKMSLRRR